jgi:translation initiation factor IF-2
MRGIVRFMEKKHPKLRGSGTERHVRPVFRALGEEKTRELEIVLKCDLSGSAEAIAAILSKMKTTGAEIKVIHSGVGAIAKQDLVLALTGSKLAVGFNVGVAPKLEQWVKDHGVQVRLYNVIYKLAEDLKGIAENLIPGEAEETVTGKARVIALFKTDHKGIILGCEVLEGSLQVGKNFRIVTAMGPVYTARIESLQIEKNPVREARQGQHTGIKVSDFNAVKIGDLVECFEITQKRRETWVPKGEILNLGI